MKNFGSQCPKIRFNKGKNQWEALRMFSTGEVNQRVLDPTRTMSRVQEAIRLSAAGDSSSEIFDFGFTHIQQSRAQQMLGNFRQAKHIGTTVGTAGSPVDSESVMIKAMTATRDELGYNAYYGPTPQGIERFSNHPMASLEIGRAHV